MVQSNQSICLLCGKPFQVNFGIPVGNYIVCSPACHDAVMNLADRDHHGIRTDDAVALVLKGRAVNTAKPEKPLLYVWSDESCSRWSGETYSSRDTAIIAASGASKGKPFCTAEVTSMDLEYAIPHHLSKLVSNEMSDHLRDMHGSFSGDRYDFTITDDAIDALHLRLKDTIVGWLKTDKAPKILTVSKIQEHKAPARA